MLVGAVNSEKALEGNFSVIVIAGWFLLGDVVGDVHHLLLRGVEAEHLHGWVQVLQHRAVTRNVVFRHRNNETTRPDLSEMLDNVQNSLEISIASL